MGDILFGSTDVTEHTYAASSSCAAIYNHAPILPGHTLVLPRKQIKSILQMNADERSDFFAFADEITRFLLVTFNCSDFDWTLQDGEAAGQTIPHVHLHVIPRRQDDLPSPGSWYVVMQKDKDTAAELDGKDRRTLSDTELHEISRSLKGKWQKWKAER